MFLLERLTTINRQRTKFYDYQKEFINDDSTFRVVNKARQLGFSIVIAAEAIIESLIYPQQTTLFISSGEDAAKRVLKYCYDFINSLPVKCNLKIASTSEIKMPNNSYLVSLPANPKTIRGFNAGRVYIDEGAHFQSDKEILKAIQPSISRGGKLTIISTPNGRLNRFYEIWSNQDDQYAEYSHHLIPYTLCPDKEYIKRVKQLKRSMNAIEFSQEYECKFMEEELAMFTPTVVLPCVDRKLTNVFNFKTNNPVYMGVDFAKIEDETSINIVEHVIDESTVILRHRTNLKKVKYDDQLKIIQDLDLRIACDKINVDATGVGVRLFEEMEKLYGGKVEGVKFSPTVKDGLINGLRLLFQNGSIRIPYDEELMSQLYAMERVLSKNSDIIKYKSAGSKKSDIVWSLAMACKDCFGMQGNVDFTMGETILSKESEVQYQGLVAKSTVMFEETYNQYF